MNFSKIFFVSLAVISQINAQTRKERKLLIDVENAIETVLNENDHLSDYFNNAAAYVVFPNIGKGGFFIGGATGNGIVFENQVPIGRANVKKLNIGLQAGGQSIIQLIFFETKIDLERFKKANYQFSAGVSATIIRSGIAYKAKFKDGLAVFAFPKAGFMADATVGGQSFVYRDF